MNFRFAGTVTVTREPDAHVARPTWESLVELHKLRPVASFRAVSPFTGEPVEIGRPRCEPAAVVRGGKRMGVVVWWETGEGLDLYGDPAAMAELGAALATDIGGTFEPHDE